MTDGANLQQHQQHLGVFEGSLSFLIQGVKATAYITHGHIIHNRIHALGCDSGI